MGSAFDAELDRLHAAADADFGVEMTYRAPNAQPVTVMAEKLTPSPEYGTGAARMVAAAFVLMVQVRSLPQKPVKDATFEETAAGGAKWRVIASPTIEDDDGRRYTIKVERA